MGHACAAAPVAARLRERASAANARREAAVEGGPADAREALGERRNDEGGAVAEGAFADARDARGEGDQD